jgi:hypothetical protein
LKIGTTSRVLAVLLAASATAAGAAFLRTDSPTFGPNQVLSRLPRGTSIHSLLRADLDGRGPAEVAAVVRIPAFPGAQELIYANLIFRYDRLRREFVEVYRAAAPGRVPFSVDAVRLPAGREVVIFSGLNDDGTRAVEAVRLEGGRGSRLSEAAARTALSEIPQPVPAVTWRYVVRNGEVVARISTVRLRVRQTLRVQVSGGGPASVVLSDSRMDVVENGFRARTLGRYRIRVVTGLLPVEAAYSLTVLVEPNP